MLGRASKKVTLTTLAVRSVARGIGRDQRSWSKYGSRVNAGSGLNAGSLGYEGCLGYDGVLGQTRKMGGSV